MPGVYNPKVTGINNNENLITAFSATSYINMQTKDPVLDHEHLGASGYL